MWFIITMISRPEVSVLMPVRDEAAYLTEAVESILNQTHGDFELVIIDDGSSDMTPRLLDRFARSDGRVKHFRRGREGIVSALNFGLDQSRGKYVARMDADDISTPDRIEKQLAFMEENPRVAVAGSLVRCFPRSDMADGMTYYEEWVNSVVDPEAIAREMFVESPLPHPSVIMRRAAIDKVGGYRRFGGPEDYDLWLRMRERGMILGKVPETLLRWRDRDDRLSRVGSRYSLQAFRNLKVEYLVRDPRLESGKIQICGAGRTARSYSKLLSENGIKTARFADINPKRIGRKVQGRPVIAVEDLSKNKSDFIICAVGGRGACNARNDIRPVLNGMGFTEGEDYLFVA